MALKWYKQGIALLEEIEKTTVNDDELAVWYIGQCGFIFKQEVTVYIDPVLNDLTDANGKTRRYYQPPFEPEQVKADYILCTHAHRDHTALETLQKIAEASPNTKFIMPKACINMVDAVIKERSIEAKAHEKIDLGKLTIYPISAAHPVHQKTEDGGDVALGYYLMMGKHTVLHLGDTYLTPQLLEDLKALGRIDLFFAPINGQDYFRTARHCIGNLNCIEVATLANLLQVDLSIPMHYDMIQGNTLDPLDFARELRTINTALKWKIPALGERILYKSPLS